MRVPWPRPSPPPTAHPSQAASERAAQLHRWVEVTLGCAFFRIEPLSGDASFRRYWRVTRGDASYVLMDAPPEHIDCRPFIDRAGRLAAAGVRVPEVLAADLGQGLLLLSDLGERLYLHELNADSAPALYRDAIARLIEMQAQVSTAGLPCYGVSLIMDEMRLFVTWLLERELELRPTPQEQAMLHSVFAWLAGEALAQPQVFVHRDYHSRNLLRLAAHSPGVLDFQDALSGPLSYDLVSLLRDCYIRWPEAQVRNWALDYLREARRAGVTGELEPQTFLRWMDLMGVQRHLKASGIFARLWHRDGKPGYLQDIPRTLGYIVDVSDRYSELAPLHRWMTERVIPVMVGRKRS
ncbi:MAG: aminoglycoside phosphotransferase family protein [Gammaproteobacteria bacterium]